MPTILVDIDGVISNYDFEAAIRRHFGVSVPNSAITQYSLEDSLGISRDEVSSILDELALEVPSFIEGAWLALERLRFEGFQVVIYTCRGRHMKGITVSGWLWDWRIPYSCTASTPEEIGNADFHIDDCPQKLAELGDRTKHKLLFDQPWNRGCLDIKKQFIRVKDWQEVVKYVHEQG